MRAQDLEYLIRLVGMKLGHAAKLRDFVRSERPRAYVRHLTSGV